MNRDARSAYRQGLAGRRVRATRRPTLRAGREGHTRSPQSPARGDIERRTFEIDHALLVVGQLHATLDMERAASSQKSGSLLHSGALAPSQAQIQSSAEILEEQINLLLSLREAWQEVERRSREVPLPPAASAPVAPPAVASGNWRA